MAIQSQRPVTPLKVDVNNNATFDIHALKRDLVGVLSKYLDKGHVGEVERALLFGEQAHEGQLRKSGEPYIYHPIAVARILADMRLDHNSIMAAILHDVIEDTPTAREHLEDRFGQEVAYLVDGVSKISQIDFDTREIAEAENFRKMLLAMSRDIRVILVKLADRLHNMRTLDALSSDKRQRISLQTRDIYAPIAQRLGMHDWSKELEDLSFKYIYPKRYHAIKTELDRRKGNRQSIVKKICNAIQGQLSEASIEATVTGREKNVYSVYLKMRNKHQSLNDLSDIFAIRITVQTVDECYRVLGVIHNFYKPAPGRFKDYIAIPKANGYQSLHSTVFGTFGQFIEVQIRTESMHRVAEAGVAAHWLYKTHDYEGVEPRQLARKWLVDLLENQRHAGNASEFLEQLKVDLYPDQVYVFTPNAEIKKFPRGATVLDFAFAVHSDIGNRAIGAKVNQEQVPLHHVLRNGDRIEIVTSRSQQTTPAWLHFVVTSKARATIRGALKKQTTKDAVKLGRRLLGRSLKSLGQSTQIRSNKKLELLQAFDRDDWNTLLADIGFGRRLPMVVAKQIQPDAIPEKKQGDVAPEPLAIEGAEGMLINYAKCCCPIPGDQILGFFTAGKGIVIHTNDCPNYEKLRSDPERWIHVNWSAAGRDKFSVGLRLEAKNQRGVLAGAASVIADHGSNIINVNVLERDTRHSSMDFTIEVSDRNHLDEIIAALKADAKLLKVTRQKG